MVCYDHHGIQNFLPLVRYCQNIKTCRKHLIATRFGESVSTKQVRGWVGGWVSVIVWMDVNVSTGNWEGWWERRRVMRTTLRETKDALDNVKKERNLSLATLTHSPTHPLPLRLSKCSVLSNVTFAKESKHEKLTSQISWETFSPLLLDSKYWGRWEH